VSADAEFNPWDCYPINTRATGVRESTEALAWRRNVRAHLQEDTLSAADLQALLLHILEYPELLR
jgi:hypothetical protein